MNIPVLLSPGLLGLAFVILFFLLIIILALLGRNRPGRPLRHIPAFARLSHAIGQAVESGTRLHITLGWGALPGPAGMPALVGLRVLERIARVASKSDRPPVATSGEAAVALLSQDVLQGVYREIDVEGQYEPASAQLTGLTPFSYAAGVLPILSDSAVSAQVLAGHFGPEAALLAEAGERRDALTIAGSDSLPAQAVLYASAGELLIGEELFAAGAYLGAGLLHTVSLGAQDILRWILVLAILAGVALKILGVV